METTLIIIQVISAVLAIIIILSQDKGEGFGEAIGGTGGGSSFQTQKRGAEKVLGQATVALVTIFLSISLVLNFI